MLRSAPSSCAGPILTASQLRQLQLRREVVEALQLEPGLVARCAAAAGFSAGTRPEELLANLLVRLPVGGARFAAAALLDPSADADGRVEVIVHGEATASATASGVAAARPRTLLTSARGISNDALTDGELRSLCSAPFRTSFESHARLAELCALLSAEALASAVAAAAATPGPHPHPARPPELERPRRAPTPPAPLIASHSGRAAHTCSTADGLPAPPKQGAATQSSSERPEHAARGAWPTEAACGAEASAGATGSPSAGATGSSSAGASANSGAARGAEGGGGPVGQVGSSARDRLDRVPMVKLVTPHHHRPQEVDIGRAGEPVAPTAPGGGEPPSHWAEGRPRAERLAVWRGEVEEGMAAEKDEAAAAEARGGLRFTVGERVEVTYVRPPSRRLGLAAENRRRAEEWSSGRVTQLWPPQGVRQRTQQAYQVLLSNGLYFYVQSDRPGRIRRDESWAGRFAAAEAEGGSLCRGKGFAVLTAQEVEALLSDDGRELLHDAAEAFGLPLGAGCSAFDLLCGCVVRRRAAVLLPDAPLYAPARIVKVHPPLYAPGSGVGAVHPPGSGVGAPAQQWLLDLTALVDGAERDEPRTPLGFLSNSTGRVGDEEGAVAAPASAVELGRALAFGLGRARLAKLVWAAARDRSGVAAISKWRALLLEARVHEHEPAAGEGALATIGEYSRHAAFYTRLNDARGALFDFLNEPSEDEYVTHIAAIGRAFDQWPAQFRSIAEAWFRWLLGLEQRRAGYPALREFIAHESGLSHSAHIARDEAGRFGLPRAALATLQAPARVLVEDGLMADPDDPTREACSTCARAPSECTRWVQLKPCSHWLCSACLEAWERAAERSRDGADGVQLEDEVVASRAVCPVCRGAIVARRIGRMGGQSAVGEESDSGEEM